ncbi:MAG: HIT family protein [Bacilli bacterium]|jgi:histidine triad (HIT) family protein
MDCIFCKIVNKEIPSYVIHEDEKVQIFLDVNPEVNGHMLIIPRQHYSDINDINPEIISHMFMVGKEMYKLLLKTFKVQGVTFVQNNGCCQDIKHFHIHIIPRYKEDYKVKPIYINRNKMALTEVHELLLNNKEK